jgi:hypothetical protein
MWNATTVFQIFMEVATGVRLLHGFNPSRTSLRASCFALRREGFKNPHNAVPAAFTAANRPCVNVARHEFKKRFATAFFGG